MYANAIEVNLDFIFAGNGYHELMIFLFRMIEAETKLILAVQPNLAGFASDCGRQRSMADPFDLVVLVPIKSLEQGKRLPGKCILNVNLFSNQGIDGGPIVGMDPCGNEEKDDYKKSRFHLGFRKPSNLRP